MSRNAQNVLSFEKRGRPTKEEQKQKLKERYNKEYVAKTKRIVVRDDVYYELMKRGKFGQTFNDTVAALLNPSEIKRPVCYFCDRVKGVSNQLNPNSSQIHFAQGVTASGAGNLP